MTSTSFIMEERLFTPLSSKFAIENSEKLCLWDFCPIHTKRPRVDIIRCTLIPFDNDIGLYSNSYKSDFHTTVFSFFNYQEDYIIIANQIIHTVGNFVKEYHLYYKK